MIRAIIGFNGAMPFIFNTFAGFLVELLLYIIFILKCFKEFVELCTPYVLNKIIFFSKKKVYVRILIDSFSIW